MKKIIYIILSLIIIGALAFGGLYINANYNDKSKVSESINETGEITRDEKEMTTQEKKIMIIVEEDIIIKSGNFIKIDPVHYAKGRVNVTFDGKDYNIAFEKDFFSADGPDLYVYLSSKQEYKNIAIGGVDTGKTLNIGKLKNISGAQSYKVSKAEFEKYSDSVIIWCKDFGVQFSRAELR